MVRTSHGIQHSDSLLCCRFRGTRGCKWWDGRLNFPVNGITVVFPGGNIPPWELRPLDKQNTGLPEQEAEIFLEHPWWQRCVDHLPSHPVKLDLVNPGYERSRTMYWMLIQDKHSLLGKFAPALRGMAT